MTLTILVCGGRDYHDADAMAARLDQFHDSDAPRLVHGDARGADTLARYYAEERGWPVVGYPADWQRHGRAAGPIRNQQMLDEEHPDVVLAFPGGRGTADMVRRAKAAGVPVERVGW